MDLRDYRGPNSAASSRGDQLLDARLSNGALCRVIAKPQFDFDAGKIRLTDQGNILFPLFEQAGLADSIGWTPAAHAAQQFEHLLEGIEASFEPDGRILLP